MTVPINDVNLLYGECTKCEEHLEANKGDIIIIYPQKLFGKYELIVLCQSCYVAVEWGNE